MSDNDAKEGALNALYRDYESIKWILVKAGVKIKRVHSLTDLVLKMDDLHINRIKSSQTWFKGFVDTFIKPWKRIRSENTEAIWDGYERQGYGNEFPEIKELNRCNKAVKLNWKNRHNILLKEKKPKVEEPKK